LLLRRRRRLITRGLHWEMLCTGVNTGDIYMYEGTFTRGTTYERSFLLKRKHVPRVKV